MDKRPYKKPRGTLPTAAGQAFQARRCLDHLRRARQNAVLAGLGFTLPRIDKAISSARGAVANAEGRARRAD